MVYRIISKFQARVRDMVLSVPVGWKIIGIGLLPVLILGVTLNYWVTTGLADWLSYILTDVRVEAAMAAGSRSVTFVTVLAALGSIFIALLFTHLLTRPIQELRKTAEKVADGEYQTRADVWADDEIGSLAVSVNQMIDNFVAYQEDLAYRNRQLEAINRIGMAANRESEIHDVLYVVLENLLDLVDLEMGWVYLFNPERRRFHLASWHSVPEGLKEPLISGVNRELCECQERILEGALGEDVQIIACSRIADCDCPDVARSHITIPIATREQYYGVINLLYPQEMGIPEEELDILNSVGSQVSEIVSNAWLQMKLKEKEEARQLLLESLVSAQEDERSRLARELHDRSGQTLANLLVRLKMLEDKCNQEHLKTDLLDIQEIVSYSIDQLREISYRLRPPALEEFGLGTAMKSLLSKMIDQAGLGLEYSFDLTHELHPETAVVLYRIAQEGLTNILRHADAEKVNVYLGEQDERVTLQIGDDGVGFDPHKATEKLSNQHLGLISMTERAELIGGWLEIDSEPGSGTTITVNVPRTVERVV